MLKLARAAIERPRLALALVGALIGALAVIGLKVEDRLHRTPLVVEGTESAESTQILVDHFGEVATLAILLEGPPKALDREGPKIAERLDAIPSTTVLTPWMRGSGSALREAPDEALIMLSGHQGFEKVSKDTVPVVREILDEHVPPEIDARMTGTPDVAQGLFSNTVDALRQSELIAAPIMLIVLLLVFRSPVAAAIPLFLGLATVLAGRGLLTLINEVQILDQGALNMASMMGLALGIDYSLVLVSRFREELEHGLDPKAATEVAVQTAGRTVLFAGLALGTAMFVGSLVAPGDLLASASMGAVVAATLSVIGGMTAVPAVLVLLGHRVNKWSFGRTATDSRFAGWALQALRRPRIAAAAVLLVVLVLAAPSAGLETGPPDVRVLAPSSPERSDYEEIADTLGPGWSAPYEIVVAPEDGTVTEPERLEALAEWQRELAGLPGVAAVYGPGPIAEGTERIDEAAAQLTRAGRAVERGERDSERLTRALTEAGEGVEQLRAGLDAAAAGAAELESGAGSGEDGAERLAAGLATARAGAERLLSGLESGRSGLARLTDAVGEARSGAAKLHGALKRAAAGSTGGTARIEDLADGLGRGARRLERLREPAQITEAQLERALTELDRMLPTSKLDPRYRAVYEAVATAAAAASGTDPTSGAQVREGYRGLDASIADAAAGIRRAEAGVRRLLGRVGELGQGLERLERGSQRLADGIGSLEDGTKRLLDGLSRLGAGGGELTGGLGELQSGGDELASGLGELRSGAGELRDGLASGAERTGELESGLGRLRSGAERSTERTERLAQGLGNPKRLARPLESGYFILAALETGNDEVRTNASYAINLDEGGTAARLSVISADDPKRSGHPLRKVLRDEASEFERATGMTTRVGGGAPILQDFNDQVWNRMWALVLLLCAITWLVLVPILRSLLLPLLAVVLNLFTVAAAFGVLVLGFQGDAPLGGAGFLDAIMVAGIFSVVFGLSIDYEVFLLARMREGWLHTGTTDGAVEYGLRRTAGVVTGAATIMLGVFIAFAFAEIASMRQLGVGLSVAVLLDATLVRLVLLPAAIRMVGDRIWTLPEWIDRRLPEVDLEGTPPEPAPAAH